MFRSHLCDWSAQLILPFACLLTCVAVFCFIFMVSFPKYVPIPWGVCMSHSFHHSLCLVDKMLDARFPVMMIMMTAVMEKHVAMPFLHFCTFLPHPLLQWNCSRAPGYCSQISLLSLSNIWHCWLFPPSSQIFFPWLLWLCLPDVLPIPLDV